MANMTAGGPCMCLASSTRVASLWSPMTSVSRCLSGPVPWQSCVLQTKKCGGSESRISTGIGVARNVATVSSPNVRRGRSSQVVDRVRRPAPPCSSAYSGPGRGSPKYASRRGADSAGRIRSQMCPRLGSIPLRRLGFVHISGAVLDCRCLGHFPRKFGVAPCPLGTDFEPAALVASKSLDYRNTRHPRRCPPTLCEIWKCSRPSNSRRVVRLAPRAKDTGLPTSGRRVSFQQSSSGVGRRQKASRRLCLATEDSSLGIDHPSRQYSFVSRSRSIAFILHATENGQYNVSSDGRDGTAARKVVDASAELFNLGLQGVAGEDSRGKLAGGLMDSVSSSTDGNFSDIATAAMRATIPRDTRTSEPVDATEAARLSSTSKPDSYPPSQAAPANAEIEDVVDVVAQADRLLRKLATAPNADAVLSLISEVAGVEGRVLSNTECSDLIVAALAENNVELAYSILNGMRSSLLIRRLDSEEGGLSGEKDGCWRWPQADVTTYSALVRGLAASLRVSDALEKVADIRRRGVPSGDEVPFGKVVMCPTCKTPLAVVQPQHGIQLVPCGKCRYQYELMSGEVVSCESESLSGDMSMFQKGVRVLRFGSRAPAAAVHAVVVRTPGGLARTHRFATATVDVPAQEGERVTVALAAPASAGRGIGPLKSSTRAPGWRPDEPMAITNHVTGAVSDLTRAPPKSGNGASFDTSVLVPAAVLLASSDAATALIDPTLPQVIAVGAAAAVALGGAANAFVLPKLNQLPQKAVDATALRQQLLSQHQKLQERLEELSRAAAEEVRMLARMCQLQNKMEAVGIDTYSARIARVKKAREGLDERLTARLELMDNYAKVASMIEIEVEMDVDVLAAEDAGAAASIAEQIERLMEVESLQAEWKLQAEVSDEVERLLRSSPALSESS